MKIAAFIFLLFVVFSCAPQKEILLPPPAPPPPPPIAEPKPVAPPAIEYRTRLKCSDNTGTTFNISGVEFLPFLRTVFFDIDGDRVPEMIAGSKDGFLRLYRNSGTIANPSWNLIGGYFDGIKVGAFSAPAIGDIDGDGKFEMLVGTGGFSPDSGRVLFFRNAGTTVKPVWEKINAGEIHVGNDATPALADIDHDGRLDLVVGNSIGQLFLYKNRSADSKTVFAKDASYFRGLNLGMYIVPAVTADSNKTIIIAGNSMGKVFLLERSHDSRANWEKIPLNMTVANFAAPSFVRAPDATARDIVISDGNGQAFYYRNKNSTYRDWELSQEFFKDRLFTGAACAPSITDIGSRQFMVTGNINGDMKLFERSRHTEGLPWIEIPGFFRGIKLTGFSRGIIADFEGRQMLITGQHDGVLRAFVNTGSFANPSWSEQRQFFRGVQKSLHPAPVLFDIDEDGNPELMIGDVDGYVRGYRYKLAKDGKPLWEMIERTFGYVKVDRYASPSLFRHDGKLYLLAGQQDGKITVFIAHKTVYSLLYFYRDDYLHGIQVNNHSSPTVFTKNGFMEMSIGDYNGNLKHFVCRNEQTEVLR